MQLLERDAVQRQHAAFTDHSAVIGKCNSDRLRVVMRSLPLN